MRSIPKKMKNPNFIKMYQFYFSFKQALIFCKVLLLCTTVYAFQGITANETEIYQSINPRTNPEETLDDLMELPLKELFAPDVEEEQGIIGTVNTDGEIRIRVYVYNHITSDGLGSLIYEVFSGSSSTNYSYQDLSYTNSELGNRAFYYPSPWSSSHIKEAAFALDKYYAVQTPNLIYPFLQRDMQVVVQVVIKNATLEKFKIPGLGEFDYDRMLLELKEAYQYRRIKKVVAHLI